ncbi:MAG TPA: S53 family peptidase [Solirubrobacteraceae bacterium]|nr:S53 family peptidase [Solirubrobacteraceae bacterium]
MLAGFAILALLLLPATALAGPRTIGSRPALPAGSRAVGPLAQSTPLTLTVTLQPRDPAALGAYAQLVSTPGSSVYHHYLSVAEFAQRFGPTPSQITAARLSMRAQGLAPGPTTPNGLSFSVRASAAQVARAFNTNLERYRLRDGRTVFANTTAPQVSGSGAAGIQGVIGLSNLAVRQPSAQLGTFRAGRSAGLAQSSPAAAVTPCASASSQGYTANQIASAYGLDGLYAAGDQGAGQTVGLFELEPYASSDVGTYQSCYGTSASVSNVNVDGGSSCGSGPSADPYCGLEDVLDIEDVIGLVPKASIRVYEGPNTNSGAYDTYQQMVTDDVAKVISTSWGVCEAQAGPSVAAAENTLFEEAAAQGQSVFAAAGDSGTTDCIDNNGNPIAQQAVDDPASQPYVTGVGGTTLPRMVAPLDETVWNDGTGYGAGGGGVSTLWSQPGYQSGFAQPQSAITCGSTGYTCREVPDVSANADPNTGYAIYWGGSWGPVGGTSAAAPTWASLTALADASASCRTPVGFANPALYAAARAAYSSNFNDVTSGNNGYGGVAGYSAGVGYDMASGLGTPQGMSLAPLLCGAAGDSVRFTSSPGNQVSTAGRAIVPVSPLATSAAGATPISYLAAGLPSGLSISRSSGRISGTPRRPGSFTVKLVAVDRYGMFATHSFTWTVRAPVVRLRPLARRLTRVRAALRIALHATDSVRARLSFTASNLPPGLRINHRTGVISGRPTRRMRRLVSVSVTDVYGGVDRGRFTIIVRPRR